MSLASHMRRSSTVSLYLGFLLAATAAGNLSAQEAGLGLVHQPIIELFNGTDLGGWRVHGTELWYVEDGHIVCESGPDKEYGYLSTINEYKDFDLSVDFLQEADGNSGVFFRSSLEGTRISGWQAEVAPPGHNTGGIYESYGRGWLVRPDEERGDVVMGEWNTLRIRAEGAKVTTWLNGEQMVEIEDELIGKTTGSIALQIHDGGGIKVRWRNLRLQPIEAP